MKKTKGSVSGDLGAKRQAISAGKFKGAKSVSPASQFKGRKRK